MIVYPGGFFTWKASVDTYANLPTVGNTGGDVRVTRDTDKMYIWDSDGSAWLDVDTTLALSDATPAGVADAGLAGVSSSVSRSDHVHDASAWLATKTLDDLADGTSYERVAASELSSGIYKDATTAIKGIASFNTNHFSVTTGAVSLATDSIDDTLIDWGTGANQINLDTIPDGTSYERVAASELSSGIYKDATTAVKGIASFNSNHFSVSSGAVSITTDAIDVTLVDWGTGANQISLDDVPDGTSYARVLATQLSSGAYIDATDTVKGIASFSNSHFSVSSGAVSLATDGIDNTLIDWGTGAGQVSLDDVPDGTSYERVAANQLSSGIYIDATTAVKGIASFDSNHFSVTTGAVSIATDSIDDTLVDWGTGANQISLDTIPDGTSYERVAANQLSSGIYIDATTTVKGIASFATANFSVASGAVTIKSGGVGPTELASTTVTPGDYTAADITVDADGRITAAANGTAGQWTRVTGTPNYLKPNTNGDRIRAYGSNGSHYADIYADNDRAYYDADGDIFFCRAQANFITFSASLIQNLQPTRFVDSGGTDWGQIAHDGTDLNFTSTNTSAYVFDQDIAPAATNADYLGRTNKAYKGIYLHDGTDEWLIEIATSGGVTRLQWTKQV